MHDEMETPGDAAEREYDPISRRGFVKAGMAMLGACYAGAVGYPVYRYLNTPAMRAATASAVTSVALAGAEKLEAGAAMMFKFGTRPAMLIHHADGQWVAFDAVCTHLGCTVQFEPDHSRIHCACHGGVYDMNTGDAVSGPPPRGLTKYVVEVRDAEVVVSRA